MESPSEDAASDTSQQKSPVSDQDDRRLYLVPLRWWKEAQNHSCSAVGGTDETLGIPFRASPVPSFGGPMKTIINNIFNSDLAFNLRKEDALLQSNENGEVGVSGRDYALVPGAMWLQALKWHIDSRVSAKEGKSFSAAEDDMTDVYPLQLRVSVSRETSTLGIRISKKDNAVERFRRACKIFCIESELLRIWDFSGQTSVFLLNDQNKESLRQSEQDITLELQVYRLPEVTRSRDMKKDEMAGQHPNGNGPSFMLNGYAGNSNSIRSNSSGLCGTSCETGSLGLTGLQNLGNTCFMNSALQCLAHTPKLVDYFLGDYRRELNHKNPLGMNGEIALAFGDLLKTLWAPGATAVPPRQFKSKLAHFAPQFSGFNQHDSQEVLSFLLDGLHEDLNRVRCKPYVEVKDSDDRADEDVADEYWKNHLARNDSIIVDVCQGQYRSKLVCPLCRKVSITFDPFMYLSLPLPSTSLRTMGLTVVTTDGSTQPSPVTITVPKNGKFEDLIEALTTKCSLRADETLLVAEVYNNRLIRFLEEPTDLLSLLRDDDRLVAYRLQKDYDQFPLVVFTHQMEENSSFGKPKSSWKAFGLPVVTCGKIENGYELRDMYYKILKPFLRRSEVPKDNNGDSLDVPNTVAEVEDAESHALTEAADTTDEKEFDSQFDNNLKFYLTDDNGKDRGSEIVMNERVSSTGRLNILVYWPEKLVEHYDKCLSSSSEIFKPGFFGKRPQESISLYKCLEAFLKEEPLGPQDMWYCPVCKKHCQASKKLDLWRLPEILVIHLKRFSYNRFLKNKLETSVDFPIQDLDLSSYVAWKNGQTSNRYMLYAISNHYGSMGGGHYTAFVRHDGDRWYDFDDSHVSPISEDRLKTAAAYVLFYRRIGDI